MIAFEISRNGQVLAVVGSHDLIGLHAVLMACGDLNSSDGATQFLYMTGLGSAKGLRENTTIQHTWNIAPPEGQFEVGDTVTIRILRTECPTPPTTTEEHENEDTEPGAALNGGPATQFGNSGVTEDPPSIS